MDKILTVLAATIRQLIPAFITLNKQEMTGSIRAVDMHIA
jgi:hypothetical protein